MFKCSDLIFFVLLCYVSNWLLGAGGHITRIHRESYNWWIMNALNRILKFMNESWILSESFIHDSFSFQKGHEQEKKKMKKENENLIRIYSTKASRLGLRRQRIEWKSITVTLQRPSTPTGLRGKNSARGSSIPISLTLVESGTWALIYSDENEAIGRKAALNQQ